MTPRADIALEGTSHFAQFRPEDDHAGKGDVFIYDVTATVPEDGKLFVLAEGEPRRLHVVRLSIGKEGLWYAKAPNREAVAGPMTEDALRSRILGRVAFICDRA